ncbi:MAG: MarR family transcriptional regulator [Ferruginibacter sp.]|nr:MarR family transcriptional regulator [Bacteroidota bacterium]MBX2918093.1 MarR family transcriptional regulator [Ferruginibacter sp.]MCB0709685.1 MarR family transcriptional regulator [Chitinophagaceae bacterium]MCC7379528.1 MarR family transcriptional regulator [Chitinophagaceae bacterium]
MSLEKDITQQNFRNEHQKGVINIIYTYNWINEKMKVFFDKENITAQQFNILRILRGAGKPISTLQIRERMLDKMSDTSRIVDRLVLKGLAKKSVCKADKRLVDVSISDKGLKLLSKLDTYQDDMDSVMQNLSATEAKTLNILLDKIRNRE